MGKNITDMASEKKGKSKFFTSSKIEVKNVYTQSDLQNFDPSIDLGDPGEFPFTRGIYPNMYRDRLWTKRQYAGFGSAEDSNKRYLYLLEQGQTGLSVAFDLPTQLGLDSDHPLAQGEVGKVGVAIDSIDDMSRLFLDIPLDSVSVSMTINSTAAIILAMYLALADQRNISWNNLRGTIQNDILKEYVARGTYIYPPQASMKIITDSIAFCQDNVPLWNTMSISGYHIREAGATAVQEVAFTMANAVAYIKAALAAGLDLDNFAPRLSFFLASHNNFLEEVAKFRAARRIWARIMKKTFKAKNPLSWKFRFHTQTSGVTLTAQEPENNIVRVALQALAAVMGGTQSLHTNSRDEALALPSQESVRIALRTQQILAFESGAPDTVDPLGGSYYVESLTNQIEDRVNTYLQTIENMGGVLRAIENGYIQKEIQNSAYDYHKQVESKEQIIIGLNEFGQEDKKISFSIDAIPDKIEKTQIKKTQDLKANRANRDTQQKLRSLEDAARTEQNILPSLIDAVKAKATLGEISAVLEKIYGTYRENPTL